MEGTLVYREKEEVAQSALLLSMESTVCRNVYRSDAKLVKQHYFAVFLEVYLEIALAFHVIQQIERFPQEIEV